MHLDEYGYEEFAEITRRLLLKRYHLDGHIADRIGSLVWDRMRSKDIRDVINIAKLTKTSEDIDWLTEVQAKYGRKEGRINNCSIGNKLGN